ncbi:hypothetical protein [Streptomyces sp. NBC_01092]|uniref:hypothetical protein n=1 Tax=Streptomyces sp. NBC_01092 TaxID=2903748 RepID=UPI0038690756|nr:hypothetical protein OG254_24270 [Streptomyces sp. NBC_01092]
MDLAPGSVAALTAALPGWTVAIDWLRDDEDVETCPIVAWAVVIGQPDESTGKPTTSVEPVFIYMGTPYSESEFRNDMNIAARATARVALEVIAPNSEEQADTSESAP